MEEEPKPDIHELERIFAEMKKEKGKPEIVAPQQSTQPKVEVPQVEDAPAPVVEKPIEAPRISVPSTQEVAIPSFDKVLERVLQQKFREVDEKAVAEKARIMSDLGKTMDDFGDKLLSLMDSNPQPQKPVQPTQPVKLEPEEVPLPPDKLFRAKKPSPKTETKQSHMKLYTLLALGFIITFLLTMGIRLGIF